MSDNNDSDQFRWLRGTESVSLVMIPTDRETSGSDESGRPSLFSIDLPKSKSQYRSAATYPRGFLH